MGLASQLRPIISNFMEIDMTTKNISRIEREIVFAIIQNALDLNYTVIHHNGEEVTVMAHPDENRARDFRRIMDEIQQCDEERLIFRNADGQRVGTVLLVYGNDGHDVICDHTDNDEMHCILAGANKLADSFQ